MDVDPNEEIKNGEENKGNASDQEDRIIRKIVPKDPV